MNDYRHGAPRVSEIHPPLVWVTKDRKPVLSGPAGIRVREIRGRAEVLILQGHVSPDRVHLLVSVPSRVTISRLMRRPKGKPAYKLL